MRTSTRAAIGATVAAGVAVALLALWNPAATAGDGPETGPIEPAPLWVAGDRGTEPGSVPPAPPSDQPAVGPGDAVAAVEEPVDQPGPAVAKPTSPGPDTPVSSPVLPYDPGYWTPERMASAKPMPMPTPPG